MAEIAGRYELREPLSKGDGGAVFRAYDRMLDRLVAVKLFELPLPDSAANAEAIKRFRARAKAGARLSHPHIVPVFDYGETENHAWIVMELVEGLSLRQILDRSGRQTMPRTLRLMEQVLSALAYAHELGVLHRNVKPGNIMLTTNTATNEITARLTDFGIARGEDRAISAVGSGPETGAYMAPEQFGGEAGRGADIWAAGVVFYELLTGHAPFSGDPQDIRLKISALDPPPPSQSAPLPPAVDTIVARALAKHPVDRYRSATEFAAALRVLQQGAAPESAAPPPPRPAAPRREEPRQSPPVPDLPDPSFPDPPFPEAAPPHLPFPEPRLEEEANPVAEERLGRSRRTFYELLGAGLGLCALLAIGAALNGDLLPAQGPSLATEAAPPPAASPEPAPAPAATHTPPRASMPQPAFAAAASGAAAALGRMDCALLDVQVDEQRFSVRGVLRDRSRDALLGTLDAFGLPQDSVRLDLRTFDADFCPLLQTIRPVAVQGDALPKLELSSPNPLAAGQNLRFRISTPDRPSHLHVLFFGTEGQVGNMVQSDRPTPASSALELGEPYWTAAAPYGTGLLVAITSDGVLYAEPRPTVETSSDALKALASAIRAAQGRGERIEARVITATSVPPS